LRCQCPDPPAIGTSVEIRHQGFSIIGSIQWCEEEDFGVICEDTVDVEMLVAGSPEVDIGRRALPRLEVSFPAGFIVAGDEFPVVVHDISQTGARLSMKSPPSRGKHGIIKWDGMDCQCTVVWSGESLFGVIFGDELPAEQQPARRAEEVEAPSSDEVAPHAQADDLAAAIKKERDDRRDEGRVAVNWTCDARHADSRWAHVHIRNISTDGCVIEWFAGARMDIALYIKLPNLSTVKANVMWKDDQRIGCRFSEPLNEWILEHMLADKSA